jgi:transposase
LVQLRALPLPPHLARRRDESLALLAQLDGQIDQFEQRLADVAQGDPEACCLMTHPGVGALTALATLVTLGPVSRFPTSKHVVSYVGLAPAIASSAGKHHVGQIAKQGATLRYILGQAGCTDRWRGPRFPWDVQCGVPEVCLVTMTVKLIGTPTPTIVDRR